MVLLIYMGEEELNMCPQKLGRRLYGSVIHSCYNQQPENGSSVYVWY